MPHKNMMFIYRLNFEREPEKFENHDQKAIIDITKMFDVFPPFWSILEQQEQKVLEEIMHSFHLNQHRKINKLTIHEFSEILSEIRLFINTDFVADENNDENETRESKLRKQWKKCLVCGVCFFSNGIAMNVTQFSHITNECKSSIKTMLKHMKFIDVPKRNDIYAPLKRRVPFLEKNPMELRNWIVRKLVIGTPSPYVPMISLPLSRHFAGVTHDYYDSISDDEDNIVDQNHLTSIDPSDDILKYFDDPLCLPPIFLMNEEDRSIEVESL